ncbi:MAG: hypothetical protein ABI863_08645 [Ginsengibacter sp.]
MKETPVPQVIVGMMMEQIQQTLITLIRALEIQVQDCEIIEIDFPKGGWLDGTHINPTEINEDGNASVEDDQGRTFDVHLSEGDKKVDEEDKTDDDEDKPDQDE